MQKPYVPGYHYCQLCGGISEAPSIRYFSLRAMNNHHRFVHNKEVDRRFICD